MAKKTKIILIASIAVILLAGGVYAVDQSNDFGQCVAFHAQEYGKLRRMMDEAPPGSEEARMYGEWLRQAEADAREDCRTKSQDEIRQIVANKIRIAEEARLEKERWSEQGLLDPGKERIPASDLGIYTPERPIGPSGLTMDPSVMDKGYVSKATNSWVGYVGANLVRVYATAQDSNPMQGIVFVDAFGAADSRQYIATPTATGPVKIISESNGVLTLQSIAGVYEVYREATDTIEYVTAPGGTTYRFSVLTRKFE
jgi:hypothetical protein